MAQLFLRPDFVLLGHNGPLLVKREVRTYHGPF